MWKFEGIGDECAVAGRKLYAIFNNGEAIKYASKGARLDPETIRHVARGHVVTWRNDRPTYNVAGGITWLERRIRMT